MLVDCGLREENGETHTGIEQRQKTYRQLILSLSDGGSAFSSDAIAKDRGDMGDVGDVDTNAVDTGNRSNKLAVSVAEPWGATPDPDTASSSESGDSETDPDSSHEWLPSGSVSSRDSSPHLWGSSRPHRHSGSTDPGFSGVPTPTECVRIKVPESTRGRATTRGRASIRHGVKDSGWHQGDWQPQTFPFTATPGPQNAAAELESDLPADFLELILTDDLLQHIADQTNLYAKQFFQAHPDTLPHSRGKVWKPVSVPELKTFFGLSFLTGYIKKPNLELYWSVDEIDATPYFSQTMPRNRFQLIWRFLHYNNNASQDATDKMYKVRPVLDYIVSKFKELYQPFENICIDEWMMKWRGRLSFKVYNPQKPIKYGIKSYILCDSYSGYCYNMQPDVGQARSLPDTVFSLLDRLPGHGYTLFMDNFYNSVALCEQLLKSKTNVCGTLRKNRGEPQIFRELTKSDLGVEGKLVRHNGRVLVVAWQEKRLVKMVTTCHHDTMQRVEVWQKGHKEMEVQLKPECIVAYNACMNGVDKMDQNIAYHPFIRKSLNWPKKFVAYLFQVAMFNAFVLYKARNPGKCRTLLEFMKSVVKSWTAKRHVAKEEEVGGVEVEEGRPTTRAPYNHDPSSRLDGQMGKHQLEYLMPTSKKPRPSRKCRVCARRGQRSETKMWCRSCCVPLHAGECYTAYHTKLKYS
ncbi:piggyBac transposable element-derived protein 4-like [Dunckerocampus dactyliophorus]|uniref:piggyBac transposable element-derived protein 4-like n=1 Tax=Dunckerocampus dactyliophorus TaxID=161453 RepID=UPI002405A3EF|nr:piggyBac transposable element-derived protein 4-like [Dunckerocampus dactyliophorus]